MKIHIKYMLAALLPLCALSHLPSAAAEVGSTPTAVLGTVELKTIDATKYIDRKLADCGLQKAIDAAALQGGGVVKIPAGTFALRRGLVLKDKVELVGAGMDKTVLTPARKPIGLEIAVDFSDAEKKGEGQCGLSQRDSC